MGKSRCLRIIVLTMLSALLSSRVYAQMIPRAQRSSPQANAERTASDALRNTTKVERAATKETAPGDVGDMVSLAGVVVSRSDSASAAPMLRGLSGYRVLLMADELRLNDSLMRADGNALLNLIDLESIQRVEVIRGPASVLYGSDAMGGVVRVVTKRPEPSEDVTATGGQLYSRFATATHAQRVQGSLAALHGPFGMYLSGGYQHAGLLRRGAGLGDQAFTGYDLATVGSQLTLYRTPLQALSLSHQSGHIWDAPRTDVSTANDRQTTRHLDRDAALLRFERVFPEQRLRLLAYSSLQLRTEERERARPDRLTTERDRVLGYQLGATLSVGLPRSAALDVGVATTLERIGSGSEDKRLGSGTLTRERGRYVDGSSYDSAAAFGLLSQPLGSRLLLQLGARATWVGTNALDHSFVGESLTLGARFELTPDLAWLVNVLKGFRSPNLDDLQAYGGAARGLSVPNTALRPEQLWTAETGIKWGSRELQASVFTYATLLSDLIVSAPGSFQGLTEVDGEPVLRHENASHGYLLGAEAELLAHLGSGWFGALRVSGVWGETIRPDARGVSLTEPASRIPGPLGVLRFGYSSGQTGNLFFHADVHAQLPQPRLSESDKLDVRLCESGPEHCSQVNGYFDLSLRAGMRILTRLALTFALENVFNAAFKTYASGVYAPGRNFVLGVRAEL